MEKLMQYIWQHRLFDHTKLVTTDGRKLRIIDNGQLNTDSGPDFFNAKISLDGCVWAGNVEMHRRASDWRRHNHHLDPAYDSVVLHVVEVADTPVYRTNGEEIPTLVLSCSPSFRSDYETLVSHSSSQSCAPHIAELGPIVLSDWISSLAIERLQSKSQRLHDWLELYKGNWEEVCYIVVSRSMGFGINSDAFERLARSLPLRFMQKHADSLSQVEAFLFGQAGLLADDWRCWLNIFIGVLICFPGFAKRVTKKNCAEFSRWNFRGIGPRIICSDTCRPNLRSFWVSRLSILCLSMR